jgi:four helix bundle protein
MGVRRFQDLVCWQLSLQLHERIVALTAKPAVKKDRKFCEQILASSSGAAPNIAEGFIRYTPADFRRFLRYALASLAETQTHLEQGFHRGHVTADELDQAQRLARRATAATARLRRSIPGPPEDLVDKT